MAKFKKFTLLDAIDFVLLLCLIFAAVAIIGHFVGVVP